MAKQAPNSEWNREIMHRLRRAEEDLVRKTGRMLSKDEIIQIGKRMMAQWVGR